MDAGNLIQLCLKQDKQAWNEFVGEYSALVLWAIKQRLKRCGYNFTEEDVSDIHQDVFFSIWRDKKLAQLKDKNKIVPWISMVAANKAVDYFKLVKRINPPPAVSLFDHNRDTQEDALLSYKTLEEIYSNDIINAVSEALEGFSNQQKIIFKFNLLYQKTHQEIAEILNIPVNTVSTIISRSKQGVIEELIRRGIKDF